MTKDELVGLREAMERAIRTVEQMGMANTSRWSVEQRVEMDLAYMRAKRDAELARQAYFDAIATETVRETVKGRVLN